MLDLNKEYTFRMSEYGVNHDYIFNSTPIEAFKLASNYEANLYLENEMVLCPLGAYYEENNENTLKYIGIELKNLGYTHKGNNAFKNIIRRQYQLQINGKYGYVEIPITNDEMY